MPLLRSSFAFGSAVGAYQMCGSDRRALGIAVLSQLRSGTPLPAGGGPDAKASERLNAAHAQGAQTSAAPDVWSGAPPSDGTPLSHANRLYIRKEW